jgi:hypothetical protein
MRTTDLQYLPVVMAAVLMIGAGQRAHGQG